MKRLKMVRRNFHLRPLTLLTAAAGVRVEDIAGEDVGVFVGTFCKDWENITSEDPDSIPM